jgi:hypothetical protein
MRPGYTPTLGPCQWRGLLANPKKQWKRGYSAFELAVSWEAAQNRNNCLDLPWKVAAIVNMDESLEKPHLLMAFPEHQVALDNDKTPSRTDFGALLRNKNGLISLAVEGKGGEPFADTVATWLNKNEKRKGRAARLKTLGDKFKSELGETVSGPLRYSKKAVLVGLGDDWNVFRRIVEEMMRLRDRIETAHAEKLRIQTQSYDPIVPEYFNSLLGRRWGAYKSAITYLTQALERRIAA